MKVTYYYSVELTDHFSYISYVEILTRLKLISENPSYPLLERLSFAPTPMADLKGATTLPCDIASCCLTALWCAAIVEKLVSLQLWFFFDNSYNIENSNGTYIEDL